MPRPNWTYIKVDTALPDNDRWDGCPLGTQLVAEATLGRALMYCRQYLTDGRIGERRWLRIGNALGRRTLLDRGFVLAGSEGVEIPHYLDYYPSRAEVEAITEARRKAGAKGGRAKQLATDPDKQPAKQVAKQVAKHGARALLNPESESKSESKSNPPSPPPPAAAGPAAEPVASVQPDDDSAEQTQDQTLARVVMAEVHLATGGSIDADAALTLARMILGDRRLTHPDRYLRAAIRGEPNPRQRFLPSAQNGSQPAPFKSLCRRCGQNHDPDQCPADPARRDEVPRRKATTPASTHPAPSRWPEPGIAKGGAALARDLMRRGGAEPDPDIRDGHADDDEIPF